MSTAPDLTSHPSTPLRRDWVLAGEPAHRTWEGVRDRGLTAGQWDCTAGRFVWDFGAYDEVVHILEGSVVVVSPGGVQHVLEEGDSHHFPHGTRWEWHVPVYVRKAYVCRDARSAPRRALTRLRAAARRVPDRLVARA